MAIEYWGVSPRGNFEGHSILYVPNDDAVVAARLNLSLDELRARLETIRDRLFAVRSQRVPPGLDDKILTAWNGMMLASLAEAARVIQRDDYRQAAERNAEFLLARLSTPAGRLLRTYKDGEARINAYLEDYANLIDGLLELYQTTFEPRWFLTARQLAERVLEHFNAPDGGFFDTSDDHEALIVRPRNLQDNATPSGNAMMARQLIRLAAYTGEARYEDAARRTLSLLTEAMRRFPQAFGEALSATDMLVTGLDEVAIVGDRSQAQTEALLAVVRQPYRPGVIVAQTADDVTGEDAIPLLSYRTRRAGLPTAYVCRRFVCANPVTEPDDLRALLEKRE